MVSSYEQLLILAEATRLTSSMMAANTAPQTNLVASCCPDSFTVATNTALILSAHMRLTGTRRATLNGTGRLRIT